MKIFLKSQLLTTHPYFQRKKQGQKRPRKWGGGGGLANTYRRGAPYFYTQVGFLFLFFIYIYFGKSKQEKRSDAFIVKIFIFL